MMMLCFRSDDAALRYFAFFRRALPIDAAMPDADAFRHAAAFAAATAFAFCVAAFFSLRFSPASSPVSLIAA